MAKYLKRHSTEEETGMVSEHTEVAQHRQSQVRGCYNPPLS